MHGNNNIRTLYNHKRHKTTPPNNTPHAQSNILQMKVLICGDRNWKKKSTIYRVLYGFPKDTLIINGGCVGADILSSQIARQLKLEVQEFHAEWDTYGKKAGPIRNEQMLKENPDIIIAFHSHIHSSKGTLHMMTIAKKAGIPVILITS